MTFSSRGGHKASSAPTGGICTATFLPFVSHFSFVSLFLQLKALKISPDFVASLLLLPDVLKKQESSNPSRAALVRTTVLLCWFVLFSFWLPTANPNASDAGAATRAGGTPCAQLAAQTHPLFLPLRLYQTIRAIHHTSNRSLCGQARRVLQLLSQCGVKSPQKEHTNGKLKIIPPQIALCLDKAAS